MCIFCGSRTGNDPKYANAAKKLGILLAKSGMTIVYGGSSVGLMRIMADAALSAGGDVIGVFSKDVLNVEPFHSNLTELRIVEDIYGRKIMMRDLSDGFIAMPGAFGTVDELTEMLTARQLDTHQKPCGILNIDGYFDGLITFFDKAVLDGFLTQEARDYLIEAQEAQVLLAKMAL